jgi:thiamine monophosphate kinase
MALVGGEDYELVCVGSRDVLAAASARLIDDGEPPLTVIGSIIEAAGEPPAVQLVDGDGQRLEVAGGGYRHFDLGAQPPTARGNDA